MDSARARPSGPVVRVCQSMSIDITFSVLQDCARMCRYRNRKLSVLLHSHLTSVSLAKQYSSMTQTNNTVLTENHRGTQRQDQDHRCRFIIVPHHASVVYRQFFLTLTARVHFLRIGEPPCRKPLTRNYSSVPCRMR